MKTFTIEHTTTTCDDNGWGVTRQVSWLVFEGQRVATLCANLKPTLLHHLTEALAKADEDIDRYLEEIDRLRDEIDGLRDELANKIDCRVD